MPELQEELLEARMVDAGRAKVEAGIDKAIEKQHEHTVPPWKGMIPAMIATSIEKLHERVSKRGRARPAGSAEVMSTRLPHDTVFLIGATAVVESICRQERMQWTVRRIARFLEAEVKMREFRQLERKQWKRLEQRAAERASTNLSKRMATYTKAARTSTYDSRWVDWDYKQQIAVGNLILGCLFEGGMIEKAFLGAGKQMQTFIRLTPAGQEMLESRLDFALEMARPTFRPMNVPPVDWSPDQQGGYAEMHYDVPLVKSRRPEDVERFRQADMPAVYAGVNTIQATAWRINEDVKVVAQELLEAGGGRAGLPASRAAAAPVKPEGLWRDSVKRTELEEHEREHLDVWLREARAAHNAEAARASKHTQAGQILRVAEDYRNDAELYFPHSLDWRGRCYPIPSQLNPQGTDLAKGLLMFAEGRELGEMGAYWLAVHGANCWGIDKAPLNDRVDWVCENDALIQGIAEDPLGCREWEEADSPFQFLAFCLEWAAYLEDGESEEFLSYLPVGMDGSCNGLQHFSAMLRDPVGAAATNLVPCTVPNDIYTQVAERVAERVANQAELSREDSTRRTARAWLAFGINRSVVKRQVMTTPYGVTAHGGQDQLIKELNKQGREDEFEDAWQACRWLSPIIFEVIGEVVLAARQAQNFLTELARVTAKADMAIGWTSPSGLPVLQEYKRTAQFTVDSLMVGRTQLRYVYDKPDLDRVGQARGIAPNFVHSYDAAHLALTVVEAERQAGRRLSWAAVHDSFGTHAGDVDLMSRVLREQFVAMYQDRDPLRDLLESVADRLPEGTELPALPPRGSFDLLQVLDAEFFFA